MFINQVFKLTSPSQSCRWSTVTFTAAIICLSECVFLALLSLHLIVVQLQQSVSRVQFLESSTVGRSIVSKQEARVCDLENKLEFQRGQVKRFEVRTH